MKLQEPELFTLSTGFSSEGSGTTKAQASVLIPRHAAGTKVDVPHEEVDVFVREHRQDGGEVLLLRSRIFVGAPVSKTVP